MTDVKVLVADDSATVRAVLKRVLGRAEGLEVVGEATNGEEAVEFTVKLKPDVVLMDLDMPRMDGVTASAHIANLQPTPIVVVSSQGSPEQLATAFSSMKTGVVGIFPKPEMPDGWVQLSHDLVETIRQIGAPRAMPVKRARPIGRREMPSHPRLVAVGASTGGPAALFELLRSLDNPFAAGIVVVQHISEGFELGLVEWLNHELEQRVMIAVGGARILPGTILLAPPGSHLRVARDQVVVLDTSTPPQRGHRPSADVLFESLLAFEPAEVAAVLLSGMGSDGAQGMLSLRQAGALTIVQEESSCAVFGMPRKAIEIGAANVVLEPVAIGRLLSDVVAGRLA